MSGKRRRGSSTRKHKIQQCPTKPKPKKDTSIQQLELEIKNGRKGKPLTEQEISKLKVRIANLEHLMGITHP